jgi:hypothetical protein
MSSVQKFIKGSFWICELLVIGIPLFFVSGMFSSDTGRDIMAWSFFGAIVFLPLTAVMVRKIDRTLAIIGVITFAVIGGLGLYEWIRIGWWH